MRKGDISLQSSVRYIKVLLLSHRCSEGINGGWFPVWLIHIPGALYEKCGHAVQNSGVPSESQDPSCQSQRCFVGFSSLHSILFMSCKHHIQRCKSAVSLK